MYRVVYRLQQKGLLKITCQTRPNGGQRQNLYTLLSSPKPKETLPKKLSQIPMSILRERVERAKCTAATILGYSPIAESEPSPLSQSESL